MTAGLLAAGFAAVASADTGAPASVPSIGAAPALPDTEATPVAKPSDQWHQFAGAVFPGADSPGYKQEGSPIPPTVDFYSVSFLNQKNGFAVGAICKDESTLLAHVGDCDKPGGRLPVIYQYTDKLGEGPLWKQVFGPDVTPAPAGASDPGFVGAVAWIGPGRALAVGGDGLYPRRENDPSTAANDPAGKARAWLFENGAWREITDQLPADDGHGHEMRGLSALGCPKPSDAQTDSCVAGGFQQLWMWDIQNSRFTTPYVGGADPLHRSAENQLEDADGFRFRVRSIALTPDPAPFNGTTIIAFTDGCCANPTDQPQTDLSKLQPTDLTQDPVTSHPANNTPRAIAFDGRQWYVRLLSNDPGSPGGRRPQCGCNIERTAGVAVFDDGYRSASPKQSLPDSYYAAMVTKTPDGLPYVSVITSPGGPTQATGIQAVDSIREPASRIFGGFQVPGASVGWGTFFNPTFELFTFATIGLGLTPPGSDYTGHLFQEIIDPRLSDLRLNSGDGDRTGTVLTGVYQLGRGGAPRSSADTIMDWGVGELYSTGRGAAYTTTQQGATVPNPTICDSAALSGQTTSCKPGALQATTGQTASQSLVALPTYQLNSFVMVPDDSGIGWAVGDKGAIAKLGGTSGDTLTKEPTAPALGAPEAAALSDRAAYDPFRPALGTETSIVPPLADQPLVRGAKPQFIPAGSADPTRPSLYTELQEKIAGLVMSRDGSEGWAFGAGPSAAAGEYRRTGVAFGRQMVLYHYDGSRWSRCEIDGIAGQVASDPACAQLAPYRDNVDRGTGIQYLANIMAAARVPMENGSDPRAAKDFEVVASVSEWRDRAGDNQPRPELIRYHHGVWSREHQYFGFTEIAFSAPDDGWAAASNSIYHFDGEVADGGHGWVSCSDNPAFCFDDSARQRLNGIDHPRFAVVGTRVYLYGTRTQNTVSTSGAKQSTNFPVIVYHDRGSSTPWGTGSGSGTDGAATGIDKGYDNPNDTSTADQGAVLSLSLAPDVNGGLHGWASGYFGVRSNRDVIGEQGLRTPLNASPPAAMRFEPHAGWTVWPLNGDAAQDYLADPFLDVSGNNATPSLTPAASDAGAATVIGGAGNPLLTFSPAAQRWQVLPAPMNLARAPESTTGGYLTGSLTGLAADGQGGFWASVKTYPLNPGFHNYFYHYTDRIPTPVFRDVAHPVREVITAAAGGADGSFWVATNSSALYRYDRLTGWERLGVKGWDPGLVTAASEVNAVAVGADGSGLAVGKRGRIADLSAVTVSLDPAAGRVCSQGDAAPCGTSYDLHAVAVAPDGSAMAGGDARTLLWRPAGGVFHAIPKPPVAATAQITAISMPQPDRVWLTTDKGDVVAGQRSGSDWSWTEENLNAAGDVLALDPKGHSLPFRGIAVDASGHGYAVGDRGLLLERTGGGANPWRRLGGFLDNFHSVALPAGGGKGALIGGEMGLVLTLNVNTGQFEVAHPGDRFGGIDGGVPSDAGGSRVVGLALLPGVKGGQVEAWAAQQVPRDNLDGLNYRSPDPQAVLHYTSDPGEPLLSPDRHLRPLADAPAPRSGEIRFAAFGKSDCNSHASAVCPEMTGGTALNEILAQRIRDELAAPANGLVAPAFSLFTGDVNDAAGKGVGSGEQKVDTDPSFTHHRFKDMIVDPLLEADVPLFAAIGGQDLSGNQTCAPLTSYCTGDNGQKTGLNLPWRQAFASMPEPWGTAPVASHGSYSFVPAGQAKRTPDTPVTSPDVKSPTDGSTLAAGATTTVPTGGASTHYAFDVTRSGTPAARVVVLDTSLRSLAASDPGQQPAEEQLAWLQSVLSSRPSGEQAVVVSETPTYSYGPGSSSDTATDSTALETILVKNHVNAVVSGRLGWNGLYWTTAPGVHVPCSGENYPDYRNVPDAQTKPCSATTGATPGPPDAASTLANGLVGAVAPGAPSGCSGSGSNDTGVLPNVVAASAGGKFGPDGTASGSADTQGFWRGYTVVRLDKSGDPRCTIVEQRPVFDWIGVSAVTHVLRPGQHMTLRGYGREPVGYDVPISYDSINGQAITHRYDLLKADPQKPYLPDTSCPNTTDNPRGYCELADPGVASIDPGSGAIVTGKGSHPRVYAIGLLSVGDKAASWPIAFEPRRSFRAPPAPAPRVPPLLAPRVLAAPVASLPNVQPPPNPPPLNFPFPNPPQVPTLPPLGAPSVRPPTPPVPPPPPANASPSALSIAPAAVGLNVAPPATVIPPPAPPIQPAPPGGARREARQRQAAAAKSEEGSNETASDATGDLTEQPGPPGGVAMTRRDQIKPGLSITPLAHRDQPSAWARGALYGGGLTLMALTLAFGWTTLRPGPRRRTPDVPQPAWARRPPR